MKYWVLFVFFFVILAFTAAQAQQYQMMVENVKKISDQEYEFDVSVKSSGTDFELQAYQAALSVDAASINGGTLTFQYVPNSSDLKNLPIFVTGIYNYDGITEAAFVSGAQSTDLINQTKKRIGSFRLKNNKSFAGVPDLKWDFSGSVNTIIARTGFADITNPSFHSVILNEAPVFTSQLAAQIITTKDTLKFTYSASDVNNDQLIYSVTAEPEFQGKLTIDQTGKVVLIPSLADGGKIFNVIVSVTDNRSAPVTTSTSVTIQKINHAPVFVSALNDNEITVGDTLQFTYTASDQDNDQVSYSVYSVTPSVNGLIHLNSSSGELIFIPSDADTGKTFSIIIKASDGEKDTYSSAANIKVNGIPKINHAPEFKTMLTAVQVTIGDTLKFDYSAIDTDDDTPGFALYSVQPAPKGEMIINSTTGRFSFIPSVEDTGKTFTVVIEVSDWAAAVYSQPAFITVKGIQKINNKPVFTSVLPHSEITIGESISFTYAASDADNDTLQFYLHSITPAVYGSLTLSMGGLFSFTPNEADSGKTFSVIVKVNDGKDTVYSPAANIRVNGIPKINNKPVFTAALKDTAITAGDSLLFNYTAIDSDNDLITYGLHSFTPLPSGEIGINNQSGLLKFIPADADTAINFTASVFASDGIDTIITEAIIRVNTPEKNNPPMFTNESGDTVITEGDTLKIYYHAEDADQDEIEYFVHEITPHAAGIISIDENTGLFSFIPSTEDTGKIFSVIVSVNDGTDTAFSSAAKIKVEAKPKNNPPAFVTVMNDTSVTAGDSLFFTYSGTDADGDVVEFMLHSITPSFNGRAAVNSSSGKFSFSPFIADSGKTFSVVIGLSDGKDTVYSDAVKIKVNGVKKNNLPSFVTVMRDTSVTVGDSLLFTYSGIDSDGDPVVFMLHSITPSFNGVAAVNSTSGKFAFTPISADSGKTFSVVIGLSDGKDTVYYTVKIKVNGIRKNSPPVFKTALSTVNVFPLDTLRFVYSAEDADGDELKYYLKSVAPSLKGSIKINQDSGELIVVPAVSDGGKSFMVKVMVSDGRDSVLSGDGMVAVQKKNSRPVIKQVLQDTIITTADTLKFKFTTVDEDGDDVKLKLIKNGGSLEGKVNLDSLTGMFMLIPSVEDAGRSFIFHLAATDGIDTVYSPDIEILITESELTYVDDENNLNEFSLYQNYPNPFNPSTKIRFNIPAGIKGNITLVVYDILGNRLAELMNEPKPQGEYEIGFNASAYASGIYIYKLSADNYVETRMMNLVK